MRRQSVPPQPRKSEVWKCSWQEKLQFKILQENTGLGRQKCGCPGKTFPDTCVCGQMKTAATLDTNYCIFYIFKSVSKFYCSTATSFQDCAPSQGHKFWGGGGQETVRKHSLGSCPWLPDVRASSEDPAMAQRQNDSKDAKRCLWVPSFAHRESNLIFPSALHFQLSMPEILSMRSSALLLLSFF